MDGRSTIHITLWKKIAVTMEISSTYPGLNITKAVMSMDYSDLSLDNPPKFVPFQFEIVDWYSMGHFINRNWHLAFVAGAVYILVIFGLKSWMAKRDAFDLRRGLFVWNLGLGIFSMIGFIRVAPGLVSVLMEDNGFYNSMCLP